MGRRDLLRFVAMLLTRAIAIDLAIRAFILSIHITRSDTILFWIPRLRVLTVSWDWNLIRLRLAMH